MSHKLLFICLLIAVLVRAPIVNAQERELNLAEHEKAVCAFLELTGQKPDLESWITHSEKYVAANKFDKPVIMNKDKERLAAGCEIYNVEKDLITIKEKIRVSTSFNSKRKRIIDIRFTNKEREESTHFPYQYGPDFIALITEQIKDFKQVVLQPEEIPLITKHFHDNAPYMGEIEIRVKPLTADASSKINVGGKEQWLMMADIAYIKIDYFDKFKNTNTAVWDYNAPWYYNESQKALLEMFKHPTP